MENENQDLGTVTVQPEPVSNADIMAQLMQEYDTNTTPADTNDDGGDLEVINDEVDATPDSTNGEAEGANADIDADAEPETKPAKKTSDQAFKQMRSELESYKKTAETNEAYAKVIKEIAEANGVTPEDLIKSYNDKKVTAEAEKAGVPVEVYKKLQSLEHEVTLLRNKPIEEKFNSQIDGLVKKYDLQEEDLKSFFVEANANGFDLTKVKDISKVYEFLNVDKVISKKEQERLEQKEKIKKQAPITPSNSAQVEVDEDKEIQAMLERYGAWRS